MDNSKITQTELNYKCSNGEAKVNIFTGRLLFKHQDMSIGAKYKVNLSLIYNSHLEMPNNIKTFTGKNWKLSEQQYIYKNNDIYYLIDSNGMTHEFLLYDTISNKKLYFANTGISLTLEETNGNTSDVLLYDNNNNKMYFEGGKLVKYEDYNSYKVILYNYDTQGKLTSIFDNRYSALKIELVYKNNLLHKIQSKKGNKVYSELIYFYNENNQIIKVEKMNKDINKCYSLFEYDGNLLETIVSCKDKSSLTFEYTANKVVKVCEGTRDIVITAEYERKNSNYLGDDLYIGDNSYLGEKELKTTNHISQATNEFGVNTALINIINYNHNYTTVTNHFGVSMIYYFDVDGFVVSSFEAANNNVKTLKTLFPEKGFLLSSQGNDEYVINGKKAYEFNTSYHITNDKYVILEKWNEFLNYLNDMQDKVINATISFFLMLTEDYSHNYVSCIINGKRFRGKINTKAIGIWQYVTINITITEEIESFSIIFDSSNGKIAIYKIADIRLSPSDKKELFLEDKDTNVRKEFNDFYLLKYYCNGTMMSLNLYKYNNDEFIYFTEKDLYITMLNKYSKGSNNYFYLSLCGNTKLIKIDSFILEKPHDTINDSIDVSISDSLIDFYWMMQSSIGGRENRVYNIFETLNNSIVVRKVIKCYIDGVENDKKIEELSKVTGEVIYSVDEYGIETNYFYNTNNEICRVEIGHPDVEEKYISTFSSTIDSKTTNDYLGSSTDYYDMITSELSRSVYTGFNETEQYVNMYKYNEDSLLTNVSDNVLNKNNSYVTYNSNGSIFRMSNVKWNSNNYYSKTYDYDNLGRNTNTYITYLENEKLHKKKIQEIEYRNLYDENNHLIGIQKSVKILTSEETFDMITYEYDKYDRLVKIYENNNTINFDSFQNVSWCEVNSKIEEFEDPYSNLHYFYTYNEDNFLVKCEIKSATKTVFFYEFSSEINTVDYNLNLHPDYSANSTFKESFEYEDSTLMSPRVSSHELIETSNTPQNYGTVVSLKKSYDKLGRVNKEEYYDNLSSCFKTEHNISYVVLTNSDGTKLATDLKKDEIYYEYDYDGNIKLDLMLNYSYNGQGYLTDSACEINSLKPSKYYSYATTYDYDKSGRILQENKLKNSNFENRYTYSYNEDGSINEITNYSYNSNTSSTKEFNYKFGRLENIKEGTREINIEYDNCGNCTSINNNGTVSTFEWTRGHLLNKFTKNNIEVNYNYNTFGQRVSKKVGDYNYDYYYNGDKLKVQFRYVEGNPSLNQTLVFLYDNDEIVGLYYVERNKTYEFIKDCQGNVISILYGGEELAHYEYDYFGDCTVYSNGNIDTDQNSIGLINPIRYRGYYYDEETSLFWLSSRYYSPELCRFISPDDIDYLDPESVNGLNLYCYCLNNPIMNINPSGHAWYNVLWDWVNTIAGFMNLTSKLTALGSIVVAAIDGRWNEVVEDWNNGCLNPFNQDASTAKEAKVLSFYKGSTVVRQNIIGTCSIFGTIWSNNNDTSTDIMHEYGHSIQERFLGPLYLFTVAIPSVAYYWYDVKVGGTSRDYYSMPWERTADWLGGVNRGNYKKGSLAWGIAENLLGPIVIPFYLLFGF